jgi:hypothetical protein
MSVLEFPIPDIKNCHPAYFTGLRGAWLAIRFAVVGQFDELH